MNFRISFPADYKNVAPLRDLAFHTAVLQGFDQKKAEHVRSIADELCSNAIEYGSQPSSEVILEVHSDDKAMRMTCQDQGHGNRLKAEEIKKKIEETVAITAPRGRGMTMMVKAFADEMKIEDRSGGGISVTAVVYR